MARGKTISTPILEFSAALLLAELVDKIIHSSGIQFNNVTHWTDFMVRIFWINSSPHFLKKLLWLTGFPRYKVCQILSWKHIRSADNPADLLSRGLTPSKLINSAFWCHGPTWLVEEESLWTHIIRIQNYLLFIDLLETRNVSMLAQTTSPTIE